MNRFHGPQEVGHLFEDVFHPIKITSDHQGKGFLAENANRGQRGARSLGKLPIHSSRRVYLPWTFNNSSCFSTRGRTFSQSFISRRR